MTTSESMSLRHTHAFPLTTCRWGIDKTQTARGAIEGVEPVILKSDREVYLLQRKTTKVGKDLGKTTGWIHRADLAK